MIKINVNLKEDPYINKYIISNQSQSKREFLIERSEIKERPYKVIYKSFYYTYTYEEIKRYLDSGLWTIVNKLP